MERPRTADSRIAAARRAAAWAELRLAFAKVWGLALVSTALVSVLLFVANEPHSDAGDAEGIVIAVNQTNGRSARPLRLVTVSLDDGRTAVVFVEGGFVTDVGRRVRLHETRYGWTHRSTFAWRAYVENGSVSHDL